MRYLVDGYNLMHAIGLVRKKGSQAQWDAARRTLLDWLADQPGADPPNTTIIFDAQNTTRTSLPRLHRGLQIVMAYGRTADEVIAERVAAEPQATTLTVVSNDGQVRGLAEAAGCAVLKCSEYVDLVQTPPRPPVEETPLSEKPTTPTDDERAEWLRIFGEDKKA